MRSADEHAGVPRGGGRRRRLVGGGHLRRRVFRVIRRRRRVRAERRDAPLGSLLGVERADLLGERASRRERFFRRRARGFARGFLRAFVRVRVVFVVVLVVSRQRVHLCFFDALRVQPRLVQGVNRAVRLLRRRRRRRHQRFVRPTLFPAKRFHVRRVVGVARVGRVGTRRLGFAAVLFVLWALAFQKTRVFRTRQRDPRALGFQLASQRLAFAHLLAHPVAPLQERQ